jgi:aromatic ring-cleaving dioxygenase
LNYDIHTYWGNNDERNEALKLKQILIENKIQTFSLVEFPIGPHPLPMFESHVSAENLPEVEVQLVADIVNCSILIHEKTNDDMYDHTDGARWLGSSLELNLESLRKISG